MGIHLKTCQHQPDLVFGRFIKVFYKTTTCPGRPLLSGPKSGRFIKVLLYSVSFLDSCKSFMCPAGLNIKKNMFTEFESNDLIIFWKEIWLSAENRLEVLCMGICERMFTLENIFWDEWQELHKNSTEEDIRN